MFEERCLRYGVNMRVTTNYYSKFIEIFLNINQEKIYIFAMLRAVCQL
jgi:hypothetical protein